MYDAAWKVAPKLHGQLQCNKFGVLNSRFMWRWLCQINWISWVCINIALGYDHEIFYLDFVNILLPVVMDVHRGVASPLQSQNNEKLYNRYRNVWVSLKNPEITNAVHSCRQYKNLGFHDTNLFLLVLFRLDFYVVWSVNMPIALAYRKIIAWKAIENIELHSQIESSMWRQLQTQIVIYY